MEKKQNFGSKIKKKSIEWGTYFLCILVFVAVKQYFERKNEADRNKIVNTPAAVEVMKSEVTEDIKSKFLEVQKILNEEMTPTEKESYQAVIDKMRQNIATKQDIANNGLLMQSVVNRLPDDKKEFVKKFLSDTENKMGDSVVDAYNK